ncbi:MAG: hypothetical protein FJW96_08195, partial [Actinobacteria bacterium]|nr:hypothetical protein [Actinomycetota bacterium]
MGILAGAAIVGSSMFSWRLRLWGRLASGTISRIPPGARPPAGWGIRLVPVSPTSGDDERGSRRTVPRKDGQVSRRLRFCAGAVATAGALLVVPAQVGAAGMATVEQPVTAELVIVTEKVPVGSACHASAFAVVRDLADAAEYRVTYTDTSLGGRESVFTFNRHERGRLQYSKVPTWSAGSGKIAALLGWNGLATSPGRDLCAEARALVQERLAIKRAVVVRYTPDRPRANAAAVEFRSVPIAPANDGTTGKDGCAVNIFLTVPKVEGAVEYRVRLTDAISGATRTKDHVIDPAKANTKGQAGPKPYQSSTRVGHYFST